MKRFKGYVFDLDGTIYLSDELIPGADKVIATLRAEGRKVMFLSNKPLHTRFEYVEKLQSLGIPASLHEVINSSYVLARWLASESPGALVYPVSEPAVIEDLEREGLKVTLDPEKIGYKVDFIVIAFDRTFDYGKLNNALQCAKNGARMVATNSDRTCPVKGGEIPDCAAMIAAIEATSNKKVELIAGKPNPLMMHVASERMGIDPKDCVMVGDRLETDMAMGRNSGMASALVLTGVTRREDLVGVEPPDYILESVVDLISSER